ncbi:unnamed protein product [Musa acuminata subsp. malaccensis]|uniref:(wild Malaysian banana) hypothetical protein n=1 Tax=Musa acuminata subsp. malaccensis TaxID=214687 RepID=A0A804J8C2_MUSAM|nr:PREDICTED: transcription factor MYB36 [Musa acuminata subsp. malaccensis]CAG1839535.1 unnamed protein product [Musa acuminata subsp. malaccensis]
MGRAPCCDKANVKKGPWSPEEDAKLKAYIEEHGTGGNWIALPHKIGLKRCGKSCRLRWLNYLRPNIKHGGFTEEEDQIICSLYISIGSRWSIIAAQLPGRTDNDIKNYWNTRLKKKLLGKRRQSAQSPSLHLNQAAGEGANGVNHEAPSQTLSASALERLQLHMQFQGLYHPFSFHNHPARQPKCHPPGDPTATTLIQQVSPPKPDAGHLQEIDCSSVGFHSPSAMETSSSNLDAGLEADLQDLLYCKNSSSFVGHEEHQLANLDYYKDLYGERETANWCPCNGLEDQSSSMGSWDSASALHSDAMIQEFALRYNL